MRATSTLSFPTSAFGSMFSRAPVMIASGVRNSCAALAVNCRCTAKPCSSRPSAQFTAETSGTISLGRFACGSRTDVVPGPIEAAISDTSRIGLQRAADRQDRDAQGEQHEQWNDPGDVEDKFLEQ